MANVRPAVVLGSGVAFALLTPAIGYALNLALEFDVVLLALLVWVIAFPIATTLAIHRLSRPNISLQTDREG
jgi:hypothetical protein